MLYSNSVKELIFYCKQKAALVFMEIVKLIVSSIMYSRKVVFKYSFVQHPAGQ